MVVRDSIGIRVSESKPQNLKRYGRCIWIMIKRLKTPVHYKVHLQPPHIGKEKARVAREIYFAVATCKSSSMSTPSLHLNTSQAFVLWLVKGQSVGGRHRLYIEGVMDSSFFEALEGNNKNIYIYPSPNKEGQLNQVSVACFSSKYPP